MRIQTAISASADAPFEIAEVELDDPRRDEVLVELRAVGVCHSDLKMKAVWPAAISPIVLGHEGAGVVEAVGADVAGVAPGDRVVLSWAPSCGECAECRRDRRVACAPLRAGIAAGTLPDGTTRLSLGGRPVYRMTAIGALAELVVVPATAALPLPADVPLEQAALVGCAALTGVGAVLQRARVEPGASVLVVGAGGVGIFCVQGARLAGASRVVAVDPVEARREQARRLGATEAVGPEDVEAGFDYAFDAVGGAPTFELAVRSIRGGGTAVAVGMAPAGATYALAPGELTNEEKTITGSLYGSEDPAVALPAVLEHVRAGRLDLEHMVGPRFRLDDAEQAVQASLAGVPGRVLVMP
jgi:S-(hydroxymethyl)glutathione dehydrogenase / alcohol dehydrogenase